jgi:hypothetical protein
MQLHQARARDIRPEEPGYLHPVDIFAVGQSLVFMIRSVASCSSRLGLGLSMTAIVP